MGIWDNIKGLVTSGGEDDEVSPKARAMKMMALDNPGGGGKLSTKDVYRQRHRMNKKRKGYMNDSES